MQLEEPVTDALHKAFCIGRLLFLCYVEIRYGKDGNQWQKQLWKLRTAALKLKY